MKYCLDNCPCGSGEGANAVFDNHGIFVFYSCSKCDEKKRSKYDPIIFKEQKAKYVKSDLYHFIQILKNQEPEGIKKDDWYDVRRPKIKEDEDGYTIVLEAESIGFVFDKDYRFVGVFNYK